MHISGFQIRLMQTADIDAVFAVQTLAYVAAMVEPAALLAERLSIAPATCWVAEDSEGIGAYLMAYPSMYGKISALGAGFLPASHPDALYLHDLAVAPRMGGRGVGVALVQAALALAKQNQYRYACLVSVQNTRHFWQKAGFDIVSDLSDDQQVQLDTYSGPAFYCIKPFF